MTSLHGYYQDKRSTLEDLFGNSAVEVWPDRVRVGDTVYPIVDDVIVLLDPARWPASLASRLGRTGGAAPSGAFAEDIQFSFGDEWTRFSEILPEHEAEFQQYFDLIDLDGLRDARVCDFGCGIGRWSWFFAPRCREIVLVDFSDAIFVARRNLRDAHNALFLMGDLTALPLRADFADFAFSIGVLHHLPIPALAAVRSLGLFSPRLLIYLYYALDNRPAYFRALLALVSQVTKRLARIRHPRLRDALSWALTLCVYLPCVAAGHLAKPFGWSDRVPLYDFYAGKSFRRIQQDAYDRFFTRIAQRVTRAEIGTLNDTFSRLAISTEPPYWHFVCER